MALEPWVPDDECETHEWRSPTGETIRFVTRTGATARMMPPVAVETVKVPQTQGTRWLAARHEERLLALPVVLPGPTFARDELRRWARALDPLHGLGTLTVVQGEHAGRALECSYVSGLDTFAEEFELLGTTAFGFLAPDPYWHDAAESTVVATLDDSTFTWFPFLPLVLGASDVFAHATIVNAGDVETWPVITVAGPGGELTLTNETSGLSWTFEPGVAAGSTLVVDTRPGRKLVQLDGANAFGSLSLDSVLWPLEPGPNRVSIGFGAADAQSRVEFVWSNRYLAA